MFITDNISNIRYYLMEKNIKEYTVLVHSIKSSAKLIGASRLSDEAKMLEQAGNSNDEATIIRDTDAFLEHYKAYIEYLRPLQELKLREKRGAREIAEEELLEALGGIREFVEVFDISSADSIMNELDGYIIPEKYTEQFEQIRKLLAGANREALIDYIDRIG